MTRNLTANGQGSIEPPLPPIGETWPGRKVRHGTPSGWRQHQYEDSESCQACTQAKAHYDWRWRNGDEPTRKNRLRAKAQSLAFGELRRRHPDEYDEIYAERSATLFAEAGLPVPKQRKRRG